MYREAEERVKLIFNQNFSEQPLFPFKVKVINVSPPQ